MNAHITLMPARKFTRAAVGQKEPAKQAKGMLLSLAMLACAAIPSAQADEISGYGSSTPASQSTSWVGVAVSTNGRVFFQSTGGTEMDTRYSVKSECENTVGRTCQAIAVPSGWDAIALSCRGHGRMGGYVGGSGMGNAENVAYERAYQAGFDPSECTQVYRY